MTSAAQVLANRSNARKSTGPRTSEGKAAASRNAVKHGLLAEQVVIEGEDPDEFDLYRAGMLAELAPVGAVEAMLAERAVSLSWRLRRAERLQSAVFATVYRENADDVVLWPKHGLPIQPGPNEDEVILGQVVMTDFARAQVLDRLLVYERRIESSLYRTMGQLRREREARAAAGPEEVSRGEGGLPAGQESAAGAKLGSFGADGTPKQSLSVSSQAQEPPPSRHGQTSLSVAPTRVDRLSHTLSHSEDGLAAGQKPVATAELGSFGADAPEGAASAKREASEATYQISSDRSDFPLQTSHFELAKITPDGVTTNHPGGNHGRDARTTRTLHDRSCETNPIPAAGRSDRGKNRCGRTG